jgi:ribosomal 50S subunit-recycling heat shock protein
MLSADVSPNDAELVKLRFKNKQLAAQVDALDAQLKKVSADATEAQALYEDSQMQVRRQKTMADNGRPAAVAVVRLTCVAAQH